MRRRKPLSLGIRGVLKLFPTFLPAKPRNIFISEQKKPMKLITTKVE
jgi:hypothetical protein